MFRVRKVKERKTRGNRAILSPFLLVPLLPCLLVSSAPGLLLFSKIRVPLNYLTPGCASWLNGKRNVSAVVARDCNVAARKIGPGRALWHWLK